MDLKDVLRQVPGLDKRLVYYLASQGYIRPALIQKTRISRRDYSEDDLRRLNRFWVYYERGFSVRGATEAAIRAERSTVFAFLPVPSPERQRVLGRLKGFDRVVEAAIVYGETGDLVARIHAADQRDAYDVLDRVFEEKGVAGIPRIWRVASSTRFSTDLVELAGGSQKVEDGMMAYVLIKAPPKQVGGVIESLRVFPGIVEANALYGESDAIIKIDVPSQAELDDLVMNRVHSLPAVESTRTFIVVGGMHWERNTVDRGG
ncbi:MAG: Lrp/AsnC family transcriptional regulator [Chloroflexota bacterium]